MSEVKDIYDQLWNDSVSLPTSHIKRMPIGSQDFLLLQQLKNNLDINFFAYCCVVILSSVVTSMNIR